MPIETMCSGCGQRLRVAEEHAGKLAKCPRCGATYTVPSGSSSAALHSAGTASGIAGGKTDAWYMRAEDGRSYGPVTKSELDTWFTEGRIGPNAQLRQEGSEPWEAASSIYPALHRPAASAGQQAGTPFGNPSFIDESSPYRAPSPGPSATGRHYHPHRGGLILTLGVLAVLCCQLLGPVAWAMGSADLREIREGRMDPEGTGTTQAGMILGIIGTVLIAMQFLAFLFGLVFMG